LEYWRDGPWFCGRIKEKPNVLSQARTLKELRRNIREAFLLVVLAELETKPAKVSRLFETGTRNIDKPVIKAASACVAPAAKRAKSKTT